MEVARLEQNVFAQERLFEAAFVGAYHWRRELADSQLLNGRLTAVLLEKCVERVVLVGELGFAHRIAKVEQNPRPAEDAAAWPQRKERYAGARRRVQAEQRVMLDATAQRIEQAIFEVAMHGGDVIVVVAFDGWIVKAARFGATLVLILKTDKARKMRSDRQVAAINGLVAVGNILRVARCAAGAVKHSLAGG